MKQGLIKLNRKSLMEAIKNSFKISLKEMTENGGDMTEQLKSAIMNIYRSTNLKYRMAEYESVFKMAIENGLSQEDLINAFSSCGLDCTKNPRSKARFDEIWSSLSNEKKDSDYINEEHGQNYNQLFLIAQKMVSNLSSEEKAFLKKVVDMFDGERGWDLKYTLRDALSGNEETI